jgi:hypothetical protein
VVCALLSAAGFGQFAVGCGSAGFGICGGSLSASIWARLSASWSSKSSLSSCVAGDLCC